MDNLFCQISNITVAEEEALIASQNIKLNLSNLPSIDYNKITLTDVLNKSFEKTYFEILNHGFFVSNKFEIISSRLGNELANSINFNL